MVVAGRDQRWRWSELVSGYQWWSLVVTRDGGGLRLSVIITGGHGRWWGSEMELVSGYQWWSLVGI